MSNMLKNNRRITAYTLIIAHFGKKVNRNMVIF